MKLCIAAIGRLKAGPELALTSRYFERVQTLAPQLGFSRNLAVLEQPESRSFQAQARKQEEAAWLLAKTQSMAKIVFDERGTLPDSQGFAEKLAALRDASLPGIAFLIGGPDGLDQSVRDEASMIVSFGRLTLPHQLVRVLVWEQLYRALTILSGHPYHREG